MKLLNYDHKFNIKVILIIILYVLLASIINESWLYDPYGWVDHWAYFGEVFSYPKLLEIFPFHPASELLPTILPTALFYKIFQPFLANLLRDIFFLSTFLSVLFLHLKRITDTFTSLIVVFLAGGYQYLLTAIGSNYPEGSVILFYMGALYLASIARQENKKTFLNPLFLSAIFFAFMVYSAILSVSYLPSLFLLYVLKFNDSQYSIYSALKKRTFDFLKNYLIGFSLVTLLFSIFYYPYSHRFFYSSNIQKLFGFVSGGYTTPPFRLWLADASWLILPVAVGISLVVYLWKFMSQFKKISSFLYSLDEKHVIAIMGITNLITLVFINVVIKQWSLQFLYFNQILPLIFLSLGVLLRCPKINLHKRLLEIQLGVVAFISLSSIWLLNHNNLTWQVIRDFTHLDLYAPFLIVTIFTALLLSLAIFKNLFFYVAIMWLLVFNLFSFSPAFGNFLCWDFHAKTAMPKFLNSNEKIFKTTIKIAKFIDYIDPKREASLWYNENDNLGPLIRQVNAVTHLNSAAHRINKNFPSLNDIDDGIIRLGSEGHNPRQNESILIISFNNNQLEQARDSLKKINLKIKEHITYDLNLDDGLTLYITKILLD